MVTPELKNKTSEKYYYEDGRRFNSSVRYILPSDKEENARLLEQHLCFKNLLDGNYLAPVKQQLEKGIPVLDSACGYGASWTVEMAKDYPNSQFFGVDISDGFPAKGRAPINTSFSIGNVAKEIPSPDNTFVFAYQRLVFAALTGEDWDNNLREMYRVIKPGGFVQLLEHNLTPYSEGPLFTEACKLMEQGFESENFIFYISTELKDRLENAGFINCVTKITEYPVNHGTNGDSNWRALRGAFKGASPLLTKFFTGGDGEGKYDRFLDAVGNEVTEYRSYVKFYTIYAQKPFIDQQK